ncbi:MAG: four helix bundle protein [Candidatus Omnitrophica bacterium]|nr:four helix bundle protein [Candidatus Omnitrophota bacterium]
MSDAAVEIRGIKGLKVYRMAYDLAMQVFVLSQKFPKEELYSLTDQLRRSSRSVPMNVREGFATEIRRQASFF